MASRCSATDGGEDRVPFNKASHSRKMNGLPIAPRATEAPSTPVSFDHSAHVGRSK